MLFAASTFAEESIEVRIFEALDLKTAIPQSYANMQKYLHVELPPDLDEDDLVAGFRSAFLEAIKAKYSENELSRILIEIESGRSPIHFSQWQAENYPKLMLWFAQGDGMIIKLQTESDPSE